MTEPAVPAEGKKMRKRPVSWAKDGPRLMVEIANAIRIGTPNVVAAIAAGMDETCFYRWIKTHPEFAEAVEQAEAAGEQTLVALIRNAAPQHWQAAAWLLERRHPDRYGQFVRIDVKAEARKLAEETGLDVDDILAAAEELLTEKQW